MPAELTRPYDLAERATMPAVLEAFAASRPDQPLLISDERTFTAAEFAGLCRSVAASLKQLPLDRGDAVGVLLPNGWRWVAAVLALNEAGLVAVPLNTWYKSAELVTARRKATLRAMIAQRQFYGRDYREVLDEAGLVEPSDDGAFSGTYFWDAGDLPEGLEERPPLSAREAIEAQTAEDVSLYAFTSGSSAEPKVVVLQQDGLYRNCYQLGVRQHLVPGDRLWFAAPLFFGYGCCNALPVALTHGVTLCLQERFDPKDAARFIEEHRCTVYYGLGPMTRAFVSSGALNEHDVSSLRTGTTGFSAEEKRLAIDVVGVPEVCSVYGLTEGYGHSAMTEAADDRDLVLHTQGRVVATQEMRCVDPTSGAEVTATDGSALGEVQLRGCITPGYLDDPASNEKAFTADGWFRTGDLGWIDPEGRLHFAGRLKEVVKVNGITVAPAEVETYVMEHPAVDQAYAFGWRTGDAMNEVLCCAVVLAPDVDQDAEHIEREIRNWMREHVSSYKVPASFVFLSADAVPLTATGKVNKRVIGETFLLPGS